MSIAPSEEKIVGDYRLDVADFGPIAKASVDLRPTPCSSARATPENPIWRF